MSSYIHNDIIRALSVTCDWFYQHIISDETAGTLCVSLVCRYKLWLNWHTWNHSRAGLINMNTSWTSLCFFILYRFSFFFAVAIYYLDSYYALSYLKVTKAHLAHFRTYKDYWNAKISKVAESRMDFCSGGFLTEIGLITFSHKLKEFIIFLLLPFPL